MKLKPLKELVFLFYQYSFRQYEKETSVRIKKMEEKHKTDLAELSQRLQDQYQSQIRDFLQSHFNSALSALSGQGLPQNRETEKSHPKHDFLPQPTQKSNVRTPAIHLRRSSSPVSNFSKAPSNLDEISRIESSVSSVKGR